MIIALEGIDGAGKSTHLEHIYNYFIGKGYDIEKSNWRREKEIVELLRALCILENAQAWTGSIVFAVEFWTKWKYDQERALSKDKIILYDRYIYTEIARGLARGIDGNLICTLYENAPKPDLTLFFYCSSEDLAERKKNTKISFFEAGVDSGNKNHFGELIKKYYNGSIPNHCLMEAFVEFQKKQLQEYQNLNDFKSFIPVNTTKMNKEQTVDYLDDILEQFINK